MKRAIREYYTQPLVGTVVSYPGIPKGRLISSLCECWWLMAPSFSLSTGIAFCQGGCLAQLTIQGIWSIMFRGQLPSQSWLLQKQKTPALCSHFSHSSEEPQLLVEQSRPMLLCSSIFHLFNHISSPFGQVLPCMHFPVELLHTNLHFRVCFKATQFQIQPYDKKMKFQETCTVSYEK